MQKSLIRVLLADDHPMLMAGFAALLSDEGFEIVGQVKTPEEAIRHYFKQRPDVVILDIRFGPGMTGLDAAKEILTRDSQAKIVFFSQFDQPAMAQQAYKMGAFAYLTKDSEPELLIEAIRQAYEGGDVYMPPVMTDQIARLSIRDDSYKSPKELLDPRELSVFTMMAEGYTNVEMAEKLNLSEKTISNTTQSVKEKLGTTRPAEITRIAIRNGLLIE